MKFQNLRMHGSEVMLCIKKRNRRTHRQMHRHTNDPEALPLQLLQSKGIKNKVTKDNNNNFTH